MTFPTFKQACQTSAQVNSDHDLFIEFPAGHDSSSDLAAKRLHARLVDEKRKHKRLVRRYKGSKAGRREAMLLSSGLE